MKTVLLAGAAVLTCGLGSSAQATWLGDTIKGGWYSGTTQFETAQTSAPGSAETYVWDWTVSENTLVVKLDRGQVFMGGGPFNGMIFTDVTKTANILSVALQSNTGAWVPRLSFDANRISLDFGGNFYNTVQTWTYSVGFSDTVTADVPEPANWAMMTIGFGLLGGAMRRRSVKLSYAS